MAFSFSNWFKKPSNAEDAPAPTASPETPPTPAAPAGGRALSAPPPPASTPRTLKTVVPNSVRPVNLREGLGRPGGNPLTPPSGSSLRTGPSAVPTATRAITFPGIAPAAPAAPAPVAAAVLNPDPEAPVRVTLGEFFDRIPTNLLRPGATVDREREVVFHSADLYSDLTRGRASVPVSAVQTACPDLFGRPVSATEDVEIALPLQRVIEQLASTFQARPDQVAEEDVAEIETPFLQVALEDSVRLPKPPASATPAVRPAAPPPLPPGPPRTVRNPLAKTSTISGTEKSTIRALTPRQTPAAPHAPAQAPGGPSANPLTPAAARENPAPINPAGKRPPSTVRASVAGGKIRLSGPAISSRSIAPAAANSTPAPVAPSAPPALHKPVIPPPASPGSPVSAASMPAQKKTARIQIPAIALRPPGAAGSASPPAAPRPSGAGAPARAVPFPEPLVSFRATPGEGQGSSSPAPATMPAPATGVTLRPAGGPPPAPPSFTAPPPIMSFAPVAFTPPAPVASVVAEDDDAKIFLTLAPILRTLPDSMFAGGYDAYGAAEQVPDNAKVELPLGFITTQLAQGRVAVPRAMFVGAMPAECRHLMAAEGEPEEVSIPLQEVFQNLPTGALSRRHDQVVEEVGPEIPTPFSQKAQEDAQRLAPAPVPEPGVEPEPEPAALEVEPALEHGHEPEPVEVLAESAPPEEPLPVVIPEPEAEDDTETPAATAEPEAVVEEAHPVVEEIPALTTAESPMEAFLPEEPVAPALEEAPVVVEEAPAEPVEAAAALPEEAAPTLNEESEEALASLTLILIEEETVEAPAVVEAEAEPVAEEHRTPVTVEEAPAELPEPEILAAEPANVLAEPVEAFSEPALVEVPPVEEAPLVEEAPPEPVAPESAAPEQQPELLPREVPPVATVAPEEPLPVPALPPTNGQHSVGSAAAPSVSSTEAAQDALRAIFMVDEDLDAKKVVRLASSLPGLRACAVMFGDGLKLAGNLEDGLSAGEGFCAMTPPFFRRVRAYAAELELGETQCVSLQTERTLLSFFMAGDICLSVQHAGNRPFLPGVREKLIAATGELARMYATPPTR